MEERARITSGARMNKVIAQKKLKLRTVPTFVIVKKNPPIRVLSPQTARKSDCNIPTAL